MLFVGNGQTSTMYKLATVLQHAVIDWSYFFAKNKSQKTLQKGKYHEHWYKSTIN